MGQFTLDLKPKTFEQLHGLDNVKNYFYNRHKEGKGFPKGILFQGIFGSGKSLCAEIMAKTIFCQHKDEKGNPCGICSDCITIDDKSHRGLRIFNGAQIGKQDFIAELRAFVDTPGWDINGSKVIIMEEFQGLSPAAKEVLLLDLQDTTNGTYFIFTTTEIQKASALTSRLVIFNFEPLPSGKVMLFLKNTLQHLEIWNELPPEFNKVENLQLIAENSDGSLRQALQLIEQALDAKAYSSEDISKLVLSSTDKNTLFEVARDLIEGRSTEKVFNYISTLTDKEVVNDVKGLLKILFDASCYRVFKSTPAKTEFFDKQAASFPMTKYDALKDMLLKLARSYNTTRFEMGMCLCDYLHQCKSESTIPAGVTPTRKRIAT